MSWLNVNLNESLSNIKGQLTNLASNVLADATDETSEKDPDQMMMLRRKVIDQEAEIRRLQIENHEIARRISDVSSDEWSWSVTDNQIKPKCPSRTEDADLRSKLFQLEHEKAELVQSLEQLDLDCQNTTDKLVAMKDELQTENTGLKLQYQDVLKENTFLKTNMEQEHRKIKLLEFEKTVKDEEIARLRNQNGACHVDLNVRGNSSEQSNTSEVRVSVDDFNKLETMISDYKQQILYYEKELNQARESNSTSISSIQQSTNRKYTDALLAAMKGIDFDVGWWGAPQDESDDGVDDDDDMHDFNVLVSGIIKGIMNCRWTRATMEEEIKNMLAEKNLILAEKNNEIDDLLSNVKEVTNNLNAKNQELRHFESECSQLSKNNEALIKQLEQGKQTDMTLHTIPEMNEHLDGQLEKCYKRIAQLEKDADLRQNVKMDDLNCQIALCKKQIENAKETVEEWQANYYKLDEENKSLRVYLDTIRRRFSECDNEREELEDQVKLDNDNMAAQNLNLETLQEEIETLTDSIIELKKANTKYASEHEVLERKLEEAGREIMDLKEEITSEIETSLKKDELLSGLNGTVDSMESNVIKLKHQVEKVTKENEELHLARANYIMHYKHVRKDIEELIRCYKELKSCHKRDDVGIQELIKEKNALIAQLCKLENFESENADLNTILTRVELRNKTLEEENIALQNDITEITTAKEKLSLETDELHNSRAELIRLVQQKHQESINYHGEIQRLQQVLGIETEMRKTFEMQLAELNGSGVAAEDMAAKEKEVEKLSEHAEFLREKCANMAEALLAEQSTTKELYAERSTLLEKEANLTRQLESLRQHLLESEEMYTKEVQTAETKCVEMEQKMQVIVEKEKNSSNRYTSANIRANQQVETLQTNLQLITNQRDELKRNVSDLEDQMEKQNAALCNLQIVLEQFQRDKDKVIFEETERVRRQVAMEKKVQDNMQVTIDELKHQLDESKEALKAAVRLSEQVEASKRQVGLMKDEVGKLQQQLVKAEEKNSKLLNQTDGRVDKMLIKNLVIGLVTCHNALNKDQAQILKIISTVLDFNQQDIEKVNLNRKDHNTWFSSLLHPQTLTDRNISNESLSQAFVKFLEAESKPRSLPSLLDAANVTTEGTTASAGAGENASGSNSKKTNILQSPLLLNEVVLPTFADFAATRNSSSILKDVLKDNSNVS